MSEFDEARTRAAFEAGGTSFTTFASLNSLQQGVELFGFDIFTAHQPQKLRIAAEYCPETSQFLLEYADLKDKVDAFKGKYPQVYKETSDAT